MGVLIVVCKVIELLLGIVLACMFLRAILSFFPGFEEKRWFIFLCVVTEIFVAPVRELLVRLNIGQGLPIDLSFFITYLFLSIVRMLLPIL